MKSTSDASAVSASGPLLAPDFARGAERAPAVFVRSAARIAKTTRESETKGPPYRGFALFPAPAGGVDVRAVVVTGVFPALGAASVEERFWLCLHSRTVAHVLPLNRVATPETLAVKRHAYAASLSRLATETTPPERPEKMPVTTAAPAPAATA